MKIMVNGREIEAGDGLNLLDLLKDLKINLKGIAVEINKEIVPKSQYSNTPIREGDRIEIVQMVGGG